MKADAALGRTAPSTGIGVAQLAKAGGFLAIIALACGVALAFMVATQHLTTSGTAAGATAGDIVDAPTGLRVPAEPGSSLHPVTTVALPHVVDRWFDEPIATSR